MTPARRVGIDVGGTKCLGVALGVDDVVVAESQRPTPRGADAVLDTVSALVDDLAGGAGTASISVGVGLPGLVTRAGVLRAAPNLFDADDVVVGPRLAARLGVAVEVDNDATCAALAEWRMGAGVGCRDLVTVTLGTGIGGGIIANGALVRGTNGFCGEIGHMVVDPSGPACPCGRRGCWERYASGSGLARLAREAAADGRLAGVVRAVGGDIATVRGEDVQAAAADGDAEAAAVIDDFARWVALGLVNLTNILDPERFVLGGGLATSAEVFVDAIQRWFHELLYAPTLRPHPDLVFASLGHRAGAIGAALVGVQG